MLISNIWVPKVDSLRVFQKRYKTLSTLANNNIARLGKLQACSTACVEHSVTLTCAKARQTCKVLDLPGIEPGTSRVLTECSTTELQALHVCSLPKRAIGGMPFWLFDSQQYLELGDVSQKSKIGFIEKYPSPYP